jgi:pyruvate decarboxylase
MVHHTLEPGMDHKIYIGMSDPVRRTHTVLTNEETMAQEIDRVIEEGARSMLPVFIYVPTDVVGIPLDASRLDTPLNTETKNPDAAVEDRVVQEVLTLIRSSSNPAILADVLAIRHGARELTRKLVDLTQFPSYSTPMSKGVVDETNPFYGGVYGGQGMVV